LPEKLSAFSETAAVGDRQLSRFVDHQSIGIPTTNCCDPSEIK